MYSICEMKTKMCITGNSLILSLSHGSIYSVRNKITAAK